MKILLIDDDLTSIQSSKRCLEEMYGKKNVVFADDEEMGIKIANHTFDVIFIDHQFSKDPSRKTGTQVGQEIRKKFPLSALILMTAYGKEKIKDFIHVGFDNYIEKDSEESIDEKTMLSNDIKIALNNAQRRIKSRFTEEELKEGDVNIEQRLVFMERVFMCSPYAKNVEKVAIGVFLLEKGFSGNDEALYDEIHKAYDARKEKNSDKTYKYLGKKPFSNGTISEIFKVYAKGKKGTGKKKVTDWRFVAETPALKARQIFIDNPTEWLNIRTSHATIVEFLKDFDIN